MRDRLERLAEARCRPAAGAGSARRGTRPALRARAPGARCRRTRACGRAACGSRRRTNLRRPAGPTRRARGRSDRPRDGRASSAAIAIAVGVRAEIWQIDVPSLMRRRLRAPPRERRERIGAVRLGRPARVVAEPLRFGERLGHARRRLRTPVADRVPELQFVLHASQPTRTDRAHVAADARARPRIRPVGVGDGKLDRVGQVEPGTELDLGASGRAAGPGARARLRSRASTRRCSRDRRRRCRSRAAATTSARASGRRRGMAQPGRHLPARGGRAPDRVETRRQRCRRAAFADRCAPRSRSPRRTACRRRAAASCARPSARRCRCTTSTP